MLAFLVAPRMLAHWKRTLFYLSFLLAYLYLNSVITLIDRDILLLAVFSVRIQSLKRYDEEQRCMVWLPQYDTQLLNIIPVNLFISHQLLI